MNKKTTSAIHPSEDQAQKVAKIRLVLKKAIGSINRAMVLLETADHLECPNILMQIDSAIGSLNSGRRQILDHFLETCIDENLEKNQRLALKQQLIKLCKLSR